MASFTIRAGDRLPVITATLQDAAGIPVNLTTATAVKFQMKQPGTPKIDAAATITSASAGTVSYAWVLADTDTPGRYRAVFEVTWSDGKKQTFPNGEPIDVAITEDYG